MAERRIPVALPAELATLVELPPAIEPLPMDRDPRATPGLERAEALVLTVDAAPYLDGLFAAAPAARFVQVVNSGFDWILPHLPSGLALSNGSGVHDIAVSEWVLAVILAMERRLFALHDRQRRGIWHDAGEEGRNAGAVSSIGPVATLDGQCVVVVGFGSIGAAIASRLVPFGADVRCVGRRPRPGVIPLTSLPGLLPEADVLVLVASLDDETRHLLDGERLASMRPGSLIVNAGRGALIDTDALVAAVAEGRVRTALDVTDPEPLPADHPLWTLPGVFVSPHVAGAASGWQRRAAQLVADQLRRFADGEPLRNVRVPTTGEGVG